MPLKNPPVKSKTSKSVKNTKKVKKVSSAKKEIKKAPVVNADTSEQVASRDLSDSREEFFRLMAEKLKDTDLNHEKKQEIKEELDEKLLPEEKEELEAIKNEAKEDKLGFASLQDKVLKEEESKEEPLENELQIEEEVKFEDEARELIPKKSFNNVSMYKKIVLKFAFFLALLILVIAYFSLVRLDITIYSEKNSFNSDLLFYANTSNNQLALDRVIDASSSKLELSESGIFAATGQRDEGGEIVGSVVIRNEYTRSQPLVATTRLISSDDKLFRIKETVNVPAGGSVEVEIYSDDPSADMAIGPDRFIIPGLWSGIQDRIYAESSQKFEYNRETKRFITEDDISFALEDLKDRLKIQAQNKTANSNNDESNYLVYFNEDDMSIENDNKIGDEVAAFNLELSAVVVVINFDVNEVLDLAKEKVNLESNRNVSEIDLNSLEYELLDFNQNNGVAEIRTNFVARTLSAGDEFIDRSHLTNIKRNQIEAYLDNIPEIRSYDLRFYPGFLKRSPLLIDKINVDYK